MSILLANFGQSWKISRQREKESELLNIGREFSNALTSYQLRSPAGQPNAPSSLEELVEDKRFPYVVRHLRRIYRDPMTNSTDWKIERVDGRIVAIASRSEHETLRQAGTLPHYVIMAPYRIVPKYQDWVFVKITKESAANTNT